MRYERLGFSRPGLFMALSTELPRGGLLGNPPSYSVVTFQPIICIRSYIMPAFRI